jgi:hypothetical protein
VVQIIVILLVLLSNHPFPSHSAGVVCRVEQGALYLKELQLYRAGLYGHLPLDGMLSLQTLIYLAFLQIFGFLSVLLLLLSGIFAYVFILLSSLLTCRME